MISQGQKIKISNTLTEKGRWDDRPSSFEGPQKHDLTMFPEL